MGPGTTCLSAVLASLFASGAFLRATEPIAEAAHDQVPHETAALTTSQRPVGNRPRHHDPVSGNPRPAPVSAEDKARVEYPSTGRRGPPLERLCAPEACGSEQAASGHRARVGVRDQGDRCATGRHRDLCASGHPHLGTNTNPGRCGRTPGLVAHEVGHEYVWTERERAFRLGDRSRLKDLELMCDGIAIVTLQGLGMDVSRLMSGVQKISRFNRERFGTANNELDYPSLAQRQVFARAMAARR